MIIPDIISDDYIKSLYFTKKNEEYNQLMLDVFNNCKASKARIIGIIIREDFEYLLKQGLGEWTSKEEVNTMKSHFNKTGKKKEFLYCYEFDTTEDIKISNN